MNTTVNTIKNLADLRASDVMTSPVLTVHIWDSIHDVAKIFVENSISAAAVVNMEDVPLGVITKSDLARYDRERANLITSEKETRPRRARSTAENVDQKGFHLEPEEVTIENWMMPAVFDVEPTTLLPAIVKKMVKNGLHHLFVKDKGDPKIKGIITTFDLLVLLHRTLNPGENLN